MARSEALKKAQKKYYKKHKTEQNRRSYKSHCLHFITDYATKAELEEIAELVSSQLKNIKNK